MSEHILSFVLFYSLAAVLMFVCAYILSRIKTPMQRLLQRRLESERNPAMRLITTLKLRDLERTWMGVVLCYVIGSALILAAILTAAGVLPPPP